MTPASSVCHPYCVVPENIHANPWKGLDFPGRSGGVNLPNFPGGRGLHHREVFPVSSHGA